MAGIGFALRRDLVEGGLAGWVRAWGTAAAVAAGPPVLTIVTMLVVGVASRHLGAEPSATRTFFVTVTHLVAASLVASGGLQLVLTRFVADRLFAREEEAVTPNVLGAVLVATSGAAALGGLGAWALFPGVDLRVRVLLVGNFVALADAWVLTILLTGVKEHRRLLQVFALGSGVTAVACTAGAGSLAGLLAGSFVGTATIALGVLALLVHRFPARPRVAFAFLDPRSARIDLLWVGTACGVALWADKWIFWAHPSTSEALLGPIRSSPLYDTPLALAYLAAIPGMAVFFLRIETDFADGYEAFFAAIREGASLDAIRDRRRVLVLAARRAVLDAAVAQGLALGAALAVGGAWLAAFGLPAVYADLFRVHVVGASLQVLFVGLLTLILYLDRRRAAGLLWTAVAIANAGLSALSLHLGPRFFGVGFAAAVALGGVAALGVLSRKLARLELETFMR